MPQYTFEFPAIIAYDKLPMAVHQRFEARLEAGHRFAPKSVIGPKGSVMAIEIEGYLVEVKFKPTGVTPTQYQITTV